MKRITQRAIALAAITMIAFSSLAMAAPKTSRAKKEFTLYGRVLQVNKEARRMLVADQWSHDLYILEVPKGAYIKITFGIYQQQAFPEFWQIHKNDRILARVKRTGGEHLAQLEDGRQAIVVTATQ
ncbi:MAG TPA: hypothetical protein VNN73_07510 [Blastocatellia bacterium]|nr:hypothetical protein [Blastocatellia bacterium]